MKADRLQGIGLVACAWVLGGWPLAGGVLVADFEGLSLGADWVTAYAGPGGGGYHNGANGSGGFSSGGVDFGNSYTDWGGGYYSWTGWGYSTTTDTQTAGYGNQYSAFAGRAASGTVYAVTYAPSVVDLPAGWRAPVSVAVTNTSYAGISMRDGDDFAKQFGAGDWFKLVLTGRDAGGAVLGAVEVYLADFRGGLETGYIVDSWLTVDLSPLGTDVAQIGFALESTDNGAWGMNTPAYLAVDDLVLGATAVPEPAAIAAVFGLLALGWVAYRRRP